MIAAALEQPRRSRNDATGLARGRPLWWGDQDRAVAVDTVRVALDAGIGWIDTAPLTGWGEAERIVGEAIAGPRDDVTLLTSAARCAAGRDVETDASPAAVRRDLDDSLVRLGDRPRRCPAAPRPRPRRPRRGDRRHHRRAHRRRQGRPVGLSNHPVELLQRGHAVAPIAVAQQQWSILHHPPDADAVRSWCDDADVRFLAWAPLASGFLADDFDLAATEPGRPAPSAAVGVGPGAAELAVVRDEAAALGRSLREHALSWAMTTAYPIVGARTPDEAHALAAIRRIPVTWLSSVSETETEDDQIGG